MLKTTVLAVALILATTAITFAQTVPDGLLYVNEGNGVKITGYNGTATTLVIPGSIGGRAVTIIGEYAFASKPLHSVTLPNSIITIEDGAFDNCTSLRSINWPTSLRTIGAEAFAQTVLTSITFNNGLLTIGERAFYLVTSLTSVTIPASVTSIGRSAFSQISRLAVTMSRSTEVGTNAFSTQATITYR
jgi:hypothetical protein